MGLPQFGHSRDSVTEVTSSSTSCSQWGHLIWRSAMRRGSWCGCGVTFPQPFGRATEAKEGDREVCTFPFEVRAVKPTVYAMPRRIALFGGSFNPPGLHHRRIAE